MLSQQYIWNFKFSVVRMTGVKIQSLEVHVFQISRKFLYFHFSLNILSGFEGIKETVML